MLVVSDTSPLNYLILLEVVDTLPKLYGDIFTTPQVLGELLATDAPERVRLWAASPPVWLRCESPVRIDSSLGLDIGEASAISLAAEKKADLVLLDERRGYAAAMKIGLRVTGTLGVLIDAANYEMLDLRTTLGRLMDDTNFRCAPELIQSIIANDRATRGAD